MARRIDATDGTEPNPLDAFAPETTEPAPSPRQIRERHRVTPGVSKQVTPAPPRRNARATELPLRSPHVVVGDLPLRAPEELPLLAQPPLNSSTARWPLYTAIAAVAGGTILAALLIDPPRARREISRLAHLVALRAQSDSERGRDNVPVVSETPPQGASDSDRIIAAPEADTLLPSSDRAASNDAAPGDAALGPLASRDVPSGPPETSGLVAPAVSGDLTGLWMLTNDVDESSVPAFRTLTIGFTLTFEQTGDRIAGRGVKVTEGGKRVRGRAQTPIAVDGVVEGDLVRLTMTERGARRTSHGNLTLRVTDNRTLEGEFVSDAARSKGRSRAVRVPERDR